jgi:hypothetical protein
MISNYRSLCGHSQLRECNIGYCLGIWIIKYTNLERADLKGSHLINKKEHKCKQQISMLAINYHRMSSLP